jgi:outer membrane protein OmpA-like peptidoglycan-associated protein
MNFGKCNLLALLFLVLFISCAMASAQETDREKDRSINPTVTGGTGLFTVYDASTLKRGEFNLGVFYNNFDRDPGNVDISQQILSGGLGLTNRLEFFAATIFRQQLTSEQRQEISGFLLPNVRVPGTPAGPVVLGSGSSAGAPFVGLIGPSLINVSNSGALVGGVLPGLPQTGTGFVGAGANRRVAGRIPGFLNDFPFFGNSEYATGNTTIGLKFRLTSPESRLGLALVGFVDIPTTLDNELFRRNRTSLSSLINGSGAGSPDFGGLLVVSPRIGRATISGNLGAVKTGDPEAGGIKFIDRRNKFIASVGVDVPVNQYVQFISELTSNVYFGSGTPNLNPVNPLDLTIGGRFTPFGKNRKTHFSFGGAYRRFLNESNDRGRGGDVNGFVANVTVGFRRKLEEPPPPPDPCASNSAPTVTIRVDETNVKCNESVKLTAVANDRDSDGMVSYNWTASVGSISGSGANVTYTPPTDRSGPVTISVTVADPCTATGMASVNLTIGECNACPTVGNVTASPNEIKEGSDTPISVSANGNDPNGDQLTYRWTTSAGTVEGNGPNVTINTKGLTAGTVNVSVVVSDGKCESSPATTSFRIIAPPPPPMATTFACDGTLANPPFKKNIVRVDNQCKAILDQVAERLRNDPTAVCIVDGHADPGEKAGTAQKRAEMVKDYLVKNQNIDPNRIEVRTFDDQRAGDAPGGNNRRSVITVVPEGAQRP